VSTPAKPKEAEHPIDPVDLILQIFTKHKKQRVWRLLGPAYDSLLRTMIEAGLPFTEETVQHLWYYQGYRWSDKEAWYARACAAQNLSAAAALEAAMKRPPFLYNRKRLYVGATFRWQNNLYFDVTSFSKDHRGWYLVAVQRGAHPKRRIDVTLADLKAGEKVGRVRPEARIRRLVTAWGWFGQDSCMRRYLRNYKTLKEAWEKADEPHRMKQVLAFLEFPLPYHVLERAREADAVRAAVGDFDTVLWPHVEQRLLAQEQANRTAKAEAALAEVSGLGPDGRPVPKDDGQ
jgi:hypothetical protein